MRLLGKFLLLVSYLLVPAASFAQDLEGSAPEALPLVTEFTITGPLEVVSGNTFIVNGVKFKTESNTLIEGELKDGVHAEVKGITRSEDEHEAISIKAYQVEEKTESDSVSHTSPENSR